MAGCKPQLAIARNMYHMLREINERLLLDVGSVACWTCHRGQVQPSRLPRELLDEQIKRWPRELPDAHPGKLAMAVYSVTLGVDCLHCHVEADWKSDEKAPLRLVRRMAAMFDEFQKGQLEDSQVTTTNHSQVLAASSSGDYQYVKRPMYNVRHYGLNVRIKPLSDRRVRLAIVSAIDRATILTQIYGDRFIPARGILPPGTVGFNPALNVPSWNPQRAKDLLTQAGYPGGRGLPPITIWSSVKSERVLREHEQIGRDLAAVGIKAEFQYQTDWPTFLKMLSERRAPAFLHAWFADVPDPDNFLHLLFHSQSPRNYMGYSNPNVDQLLSQARVEPDISVRVGFYRRAEQLIMDDAAVLPVWHQPYERVFQPYVRSVEVNGLGDPYIPMRKIWLDAAAK